MKTRKGVHNTAGTGRDKSTSFRVLILLTTTVPNITVYQCACGLFFARKNKRPRDICHIPTHIPRLLCSELNGLVGLSFDPARYARHHIDRGKHRMPDVGTHRTGTRIGIRLLNSHRVRVLMKKASGHLVEGPLTRHCQETREKRRKDQDVNQVTPS